MNYDSCCLLSRNNTWQEHKWKKSRKLNKFPEQHEQYWSPFTRLFYWYDMCWLSNTEGLVQHMHTLSIASTVLYVFWDQNYRN